MNLLTIPDLFGFLLLLLAITLKIFYTENKKSCYFSSILISIVGLLFIVGIIGPQFYMGMGAAFLPTGIIFFAIDAWRFRRKKV